jgi:predicted HAD superfamily phosphohydrolase YqeG
MLYKNDSGEQVIKIKGLKKHALKGVSLDQLSSLLKKDEKLSFNQIKWLKLMDQATIKILETNYSLRVTANKRNLVYENGQLVLTTPFELS